MIPIKAGHETVPEPAMAHEPMFQALGVPVKVDDKTVVMATMQLAKKGAFISLFRDSKLLERLRSITNTQKGHWLEFAARSVLSEILDQLGCYKDAAEWVTPELGAQALGSLRGNLNSSVDPFLVVAETMLILQSAISQFRRESDKSSARVLLDNTINLVERPGLQAMPSRHTRTLLFFWRGRIHSSQYSFNDAEADFQRSLDELDLYLKEELLNFSITDESQRDQLIIGTYLLAAILGFGLGSLRQLQGKLVDSLQFLRVAVPLSRGSLDFHRRGYAHLLMGTALRSRGEVQDLRDARGHLKTARDLFGGRDENDARDVGQSIPVHHLHLARAKHQLALAIYTARDSSPSDTLERAEELNEKAEEDSNSEQCKQYRDVVLDYGIEVLRSLIKTELGAYSGSEGAVERACHAIQLGKALPKWTHGWAWVAKGIALYARWRSDQREFDDEENAIRAFEKAALDEDVRSIDRAAAYLWLSRIHSNRKDWYKAVFYDDRAKPLVDISEAGWVKTLQAESQKELGAARSLTFSFDVTQLLTDSQKAAEAWAYMSGVVEDELRIRVLRLKYDDAKKYGVQKVADDLGVSRGTLYAWFKAAGLTFR